MSKTSRMVLLSIALAGMAFAGPVAAARTADEIKALKEEVAALREGQDQMQKDLDEIKKLLQQGSRPAAPSVKPFAPRTITLGEIASRGSQDAPVTLIEYSDYDCPFCKRHATTVLPTLIEQYIDTGRLRFVMREYPIDRLHPRAMAASEAVLCAGDQGQYWGMHDAMFADQKANTDEEFLKMAGDLGLDLEAFKACVGGDKFAAKISAHLAEGQGLGVSGTPSFVVGLTDPKDPDKVNLTKFIRGAQPLQAFQSAIDELLKAAEQAP